LIHETFDVINPPEGPSVLNVLLRAGQGEDVTLVLWPIGGNEDPFTLTVSEVRLEHDNASGIFLLDAKTEHGVLSGRLFPAALPDTPVGRVTVATERGFTK
jgi:hypothetical protein